MSGTPSVITIYMPCRFCRQMISLPLLEAQADKELERINLKASMKPATEHMMKRHKGKLVQVAQENETREKAEAARLGNVPGVGSSAVLPERLSRLLDGGKGTSPLIVPGKESP